MASGAARMETATQAAVTSLVMRPPWKEPPPLAAEEARLGDRQQLLATAASLDGACRASHKHVRPIVTFSRPLPGRLRDRPSAHTSANSYLRGTRIRGSVRRSD